MDRLHPTRLLLRAPWFRALLVLGALLVYALLFVPVYHAVPAGPSLIALAAGPIVLAGWLLGFRGGLLVALLFFPLNILLLNLAGEHRWQVMVLVGGLGSALLIGVGAGTGGLRELNRRIRAQARALARQQANLKQQIAERQRAEAALVQQNEYLDALYDTTAALIHRLDLAGLLEDILARAGALIDTSHGFIYLAEPGAEEMVMRVGVGVFTQRVGIRRKAGVGMSGIIWQTGRPMAVEDYNVWPERVPALGSGLFHALVGVPLTSGGQTIGVIGLAYIEPGRVFGDDEIGILSRFAHLASLALDNARLYTAAQQELAERKRAEEALRFLAEASTVLAASLNYESTLATLVRLTVPYLADWCVISMPGPDGSIRRIGGAHVDPNKEPLLHEMLRRYPLNPSSSHVVPQALRTGRSEIAVDTGEFMAVTSPKDEDEITFLLSLGFQSYMLVPLITSGRTLGVLTFVMGASGRRYSKAELTLAEDLARRAALAVENARLFDELQTSEHRYRTLVEQAADSIFITDRAGAIVDANEQAATLLGYSRVELLDLRLADLVAPPDTATTTMLEGMHRGTRVSVGLQLRQRDGQIVPVEINAGRIGDDVILAIVRDVSERQHLEAQLRQAQKLEAVGTLANGIAHDFNNMLASITGLAELVLDDLPAADPRRGDIEQIARAAQRGTSLTRQLLSFSRPVAVERHPLDLGEVVQETFQLLRSTIPSTIRILPEIELGTWIVEADPTQLQQVLINLVVNARDALPSGGTIRIAVANRQVDSPDGERRLGIRAGRYVRVSVADDGVGMDEATLNRMFEPFFTTKAAGKGTGLGLAIAHSIVRGHGGVIDVSSAVGQGTEIAIYLPAISAPPYEVASLRAEAPHGHGELILVVDDETSVRQLGQRLLERSGYQALTAEDGVAAISAYRKRYKDIAAVVLDLTMPGMDGRATFQALRTIDPTLPVIFCSGQSSAELSPQLTSPGTLFLPKPYTLAELSRAVAQALQARG